MTRWELQKITVRLGGSIYDLVHSKEVKIKKEEIDLYKLKPGWRVDEKSKKAYGPSGWEEAQKLAEEGWELVSVTGINKKLSLGEYSETGDLLFVFKRPKEEGS